MTTAAARTAQSVRAGLGRIGTFLATGGLVVLVGWASAWPAVAQPAPKLTSLTPEWVQRGAAVEITVTGENLSGVTGFLIDGDPGLTVTNAMAAEPLPSNSAVTVESTGGGITRVEPARSARDDKKLVLRVTAAAGATLAARELRVTGPGGVSNPLNLNVGQWLEVARRDGNETRVDAQVLELPAVISGAVSAPAQTNFFRFKAKANEEFVFEVDAARRGSPLDSSLAVYDLDGRELARNEDAIGLDSLLMFTVPKAGEYVAALRDFRFRGGGEYRYRLTAGPIPYIETVFPFGGQRGRTVEVTVQGRNLEGTTKLMLDIAGNAPRTQEIRVKTARGDSNLVPFNVSDGPETLEAEPNDAMAQSQKVTIPAVVNGRIQSEGDVDRFHFRAEQDQKLVLDVAAGRFGSKLDALLVLTDTNGTVVAQNDDAAGTDARIEFDAKKGAEYVVAVRDLTDRGGDRFGYRLGIRPPSAGAGPSFSARFLPDTPRVHRDGTVVVRCEVTRAGGFDGPVRLVWEDLPAGVFGEPLVMPNLPHSGLMPITATRAASVGSFPLRLSASGVIGGRLVTVPAEPVSGDRSVRRGYLTILESAPFSIDVMTPSLVLEQKQAGELEVMAARRDGFAGDIKIVVEGFNAGREGIARSFDGGTAVVKAGEVVGRIGLTPKMDSEVGTRTVVIRGEASAGGRQYATYTQPVAVGVTTYPLTLSSTLPRLSLAVLPPGSASAAGEAETKIRVERRGGFSGAVELRLEGLPEGVRGELPGIPADAGEVTLKLTATDKAKLGTNYTLTVIGAAVFNDKNYKARTGPIGLTVTLPEPMEVATNAVAGRADGGVR